MSSLNPNSQKTVEVFALGDVRTAATKARDTAFRLKKMGLRLTGYASEYNEAGEHVGLKLTFTVSAGCEQKLHNSSNNRTANSNVPQQQQPSPSPSPSPSSSSSSTIVVVASSTAAAAAAVSNLDDDQYSPASSVRIVCENGEDDNCSSHRSTNMMFTPRSHLTDDTASTRTPPLLTWSSRDDGDTSDDEDEDPFAEERERSRRLKSHEDLIAKLAKVNVAGTSPSASASSPGSSVASISMSSKSSAATTRSPRQQKLRQ